MIRTWQSDYKQLLEDKRYQLWSAESLKIELEAVREMITLHAADRQEVERLELKAAHIESILGEAV